LLEVLSALESAIEPRTCWQLAEGRLFSAGIALRVARDLEVLGYVDVLSVSLDSGRSKKHFSLSNSGRIYADSVRVRIRGLGF